VHEQRAQAGAGGEQAREHAVLEQIGNLEPVADGMQALPGQVVGVVAAFAGVAGPRCQRGAHTLAHLLLLLVELLLRRLLPREMQVAHRRHEPQADGAAGRKPHRAVERVAGGLAQEAFDGDVREVAGGEDVRNLPAEGARRAPGLGEMHLDEVAVGAAEGGKRMQPLHHAAPCVQRLPTPAA